MPKFAWVKNVYTLRKQVGKIGDLLSPTHLFTSLYPQQLVRNYPKQTKTIVTFITYLSTLKNGQLPLLNIGYTHFPQDLLIEERKVNLKR